VAPVSYRSPPPEGATVPRRAFLSHADLVPAFVLLWIVSVLRVVGGIVRHEAFGAEASLAAMACVGVPWLLVQSWMASRRARVIG
jgi:hypothetical protein